MSRCRSYPAFAARDFSFYRGVLGLDVAYKTGVYAVLARDGVQLHIYPERDGAVGGNNSACFSSTAWTRSAKPSAPCRSLQRLNRHGAGATA